MRLIVRLSLIASVLAAFALTCAAQVFPAPEGEFRSDYDRFTDKTRVNLLLLQLAAKQYEFDYQRLYVTVASEFESKRPTRKPDFVLVFFASWSLFDDRYREPASLYAIIDGERKFYGQMVPMERTVINGKHVVTLGNRMSFSDLMHVANAKKVEMRLGELEFSLNMHLKCCEISLPE